MKWNNVKDKLPESGQQVLAYYYEPIDDNDGIDQCGVFTYYKAGAILDNEISPEERKAIARTKGSQSERLLALLFASRKVMAKEDGFYMYDTNKDGLGEWRRHNDDITHWRAFPTRGEVCGEE